MIPDSLKSYIYYEEPDIVLLHGDCLEILPLFKDNGIDLVLTDPPYGLGAGSGTRGKIRASKHTYENKYDSPEYVNISCASAINMALNICSRMILTPGSAQFMAYPLPDSLGMFYQPATVSMHKWGRADCQPIFYYGRDPRIGKSISKCSIKLTEMPSDKRHPCSKPQKAWEWLLEKGSLENDLILDPFLGSGTTAVAAKQLGRKCIGIELESKYLDMAIERLKQEVLF